ncbi:MAG: DUF479 domain-containing protein [Phaeodactylibacter sp.]|nr:DUF479 domain-containing protein [Phaeodactylibacter sp.]MCB9288376.1 DUF479 domain-containing protein [Lewinellaceae bacterium]
MNFLAHIFLSCGHEELLIGNFLADYLNNEQARQYPEAIQEGVRLHRAIDTYTDNHPEVLKGVRRLYEAHSKYAPVIIDVFYDYLLSCNWHRYSDQPLPEFTREVYQVLEENMALMPPGLKRHLPMMIADDWLRSYGSHNGLAITFRRMKNRVSRPEYLDGALESLMLHHEGLNEEFNTFFPEVIEYVHSEFLSQIPKG